MDLLFTREESAVEIEIASLSFDLATCCVPTWSCNGTTVAHVRMYGVATSCKCWKDIRTQNCIVWCNTYTAHTIYNM